MIYTDPYTGNSHYIYPTGHPDTYPFGYFGDGSGARFNYYPVAMRIELLEWQIVNKRNLLPRLRGAEIDIVLAQITKLESWICELQMNVIEETQRLLCHRETYVDKLTPRDRQVIEAENINLLAVVANPDLHR